MTDVWEEIKKTQEIDLVMADEGSMSASMFTLRQVRWLISEVKRLRADLPDPTGPKEK